jgi:hypothetical protein
VEDFISESFQDVFLPIYQCLGEEEICESGIQQGKVDIVSLCCLMASALTGNLTAYGVG